MTPPLSCAPGERTFLRVKVPNPPGSGKETAEGKGVHREMESEGSRMSAESRRANLRSDEQKSHMRLCMGVRLHEKSKPDNYTEPCMIDVADVWRERTCEYPGRPVRYALKRVSTVARQC